MFFLGQISETHLDGTDQRIQACARRAITTTAIDFQVFEGLRTLERQRLLVANGSSRTLNSEHLTGRALDLVPWVGGKLSWRTPLCIQIAIAMREASIYFGTALTWGAVWDRRLSELDPTRLEREIAEYVRRYQAQHGQDEHPLHDPDHFQLASAA